MGLGIAQRIRQTTAGLLLALLAVILCPLPASAAIVPGPGGYSSRVDATVTLTGSGQYLYSFEVFNTTLAPAQFQGVPVIMDWELPFFSLNDFDISSITSPPGWRHEIVTPPMPPSFWNYDAASDPLLDPNQGGDPNLYGPNPEVFNNPPYVLHWVTDDPEVYGIFPGDSLNGFGFLSNFSPFNAPYLASWVDFPPRGGDPPIPDQAFGTPLSPARMGAQQFLIPEPASVLFLAVGGGMVLVYHRQRKARQR